MSRFLLRRVLSALLLAFVVASAGLVLARLAGGDYVSYVFGLGARQQTVEQLRIAQGLDRPFLEQYASWVAGLVRLDFGRSLLYQRPVGPLVISRAVNSAVLAIGALLLACGLGLPLGVFSGSRSRGFLRQTVRALSIVGLSVPPLISSLLLVWMAAVTGWFPIGGMSTLASPDAGTSLRIRDLLWHLPVPVFALALPLVATLERVQSQAMAEALKHPCMTAAVARGASPSRVLWTHALRLSAKTAIAVGGLLAGVVLSGSFAVELVTAWPGLGRLTYDALVARDVALVAGCATAGALLVAFGLLLSDVLLAVVDRRTLEVSEDDTASVLRTMGR